ncbi:MAG: tryptophan halogenase family protein [Cellvibrio sp.]|uniref:tryptophan halogenase family protein n=1 Tax=Cellvibrio sp. TaxID=1965322 RepID=UPI0031B3283A
MQRKIVILGGGTAGWIVAARLAAERIKIDSEPIAITLVESSDVPTIGVGEGTWPSMRDTLEKIGIGEQEFLQFCSASFKQGSRFINWCVGQGESYDHPFTLPPGSGKASRGATFQDINPPTSFAHWLCVQSHAIDAGVAPKQLQTPDYAGVLNYGYHLDAGKFAQLLKMHAVDRLGVMHVIGHFKTADISGEGLITALNLADGTRLEADFFIDASGTHNQLIGGVLPSEFVSLADVSPNDRALAIPVAYPNADDPIHSATLSTAQEAGWIWDIGLQHRRGVGYVYASAFSTEERAREVLAAYVANINKDVSVAEARQLVINPGYRLNPWVGNCVAVGMSAGFIEPLEASALVMVELTASYLCENLPAPNSALAGIALRYNTLFVQRWNRIRDFLQLHYLLSDRRDSAYWRHVTENIPVTDRLKNLLEEWRYRDPVLNDFGHFMELFPSASYQYILMGMQPSYMKLCVSRTDDKRRELLKEIESSMAKRDGYLTHLPHNRNYFNKLKEKMNN